MSAETYRHRTATFNSSDTISSSARHGVDTFVTGSTRCPDPSDLGETLPVPVRSKAPPVVAVVLAAGAGTRFRGPGHKLDAAVGGRTLVDRAVGAAVSAGVGPVVVVTAGQLASDIHPSVVHVVNDRWAEGQITSLRRGIEAARELGAGAVIVGLGDQPFVTPDAWRAVAAADAAIAVATYDGRRGHPVKLRADVWDLLPREGDEGARSLMRLRPDLVAGVPCDGSPIDIDTVEDLRRWQNNSSTSSRSTGRSSRPGR
jgi:CTP:molybdopterin cytidylyltransferase MocA